MPNKQGVYLATPSRKIGRHLGHLKRIDNFFTNFHGNYRRSFNRTVISKARWRVQSQELVRERMNEIKNF